MYPSNPQCTGKNKVFSFSVLFFCSGFYKELIRNACTLQYWSTNTLSVKCFYIKNNWLLLNEHFSIVINQSTFNFLATLIDKNCVVVAEFKKHSFEINGWLWILTWPDQQVDPLKPRGAMLGRRTQIHTLRLKSEKVRPRI